MDPRHPDQPDPPEPFVAKSPGDLAALAPIALGFHPQDSVVMMALGTRTLHARVDLPPHTEDCGAVAQTLLAPVTRHRLSRVVFLLYGESSPQVVRQAEELMDRFTLAGVDVIDVIRVHEGFWFAMLPGRPAADYEGVPCDPDAHPFAARAVVEGRVTLGSREAVRASIAPDARAVDRTRKALAFGVPGPMPADRMVEVVQRCTRSGGCCSTSEAIGLALAVRVGAVRDQVWCRLERHEAAVHVAFWRDVVRRLPEELVAAPAAVLAFTAWLAGEGALAWCAVDRCTDVVPDHSLASLVSDMLESAVPPAAWDDVRARLAAPPLSPENGAA